MKFLCIQQSTFGLKLSVLSSFLILATNNQPLLSTTYKPHSPQFKLPYTPQTTITLMANYCTNLSHWTSLTSPQTNYSSSQASLKYLLPYQQNLPPTPSMPTHPPTDQLTPPTPTTTATAATSSRPGVLLAVLTLEVDLLGVGLELGELPHRWGQLLHMGLVRGAWRRRRACV